MADLLQGTGYRAEDELEALRRQVEGERFGDAETIRRFVDRYVATNPDLARTKSASTVADLLEQVRSELGPAEPAPAGTDAVIGDHVRDLVLGRARASEDSSRWGVHHGAAQITMHSGQFVYDTEDIVVDGAGIDFRFRRTYKSSGFTNGALGVNWDHDYDLRLRVLDGGARIARLTGSFQECSYTRHGRFGDSPAFAFWVPPPGEHSIVVAAADLPAFGMAALPGCAYVLRRADGLQQCFEEDPGFAERYRLRRIQDRRGNYLDFSYRPSGSVVGEYLDRIEINCPHRFVTFGEYDDNGRILCIRDHVGRQWRYAYDDFGDLVAATGPGTGRYPDGHTENYVYSTGAWPPDLQHRLTQVYDTAGRLYLENEYGSDRGLLSFGRVVRQREGGGERLLEYEDLSLQTGTPTGEEPAEEDAPAHQTVLVRRNGHPVHYVYNAVGNLIAREEDVWDGSMRRRLSARYRYNRDGALIASITPEGRTTHVLYGRDVYMHAAGEPSEAELLGRADLDWRTRLGFGNRLATVHRAHSRALLPLGAGPAVDDLYAWACDPEDIVVKLTYEGTHQRLTSVSHPSYTRSPFPDAVEDGPQENPDFVRSLTILDHDPAGNVTRIHHPPTTRDGVHELDGADERFLAYDGHGRLQLYEDRAGTRQRFAYSPPSPTFEHPDAAKEGYLREHTIDPAEPLRNPRGLNLTTVREVNAAGAVTRLTTPKGTVIDFVVDPLDRVTDVVRTLSPGVTYRTRYTYCRNRRVERVERSVRDAAGNPLGDGVEVRFLAYDENDNVVRDELGGVGSADRLVTRHTYDDGDLRVGVSSPRGVRTRIRYDERRLPYRIVRGAGSAEAVTNRYRHDGDGLLIEQRDGRDLRTVLSYDVFGRHVGTLDHDATGAPVRLVRQDYDKAGNLTVERLFAPEGAGYRLLCHVQHLYDERSQRIETRVRRFRTPPHRSEAAVADRYDAVPIDEAVRTLYRYDPAGHLARVERHGRRLDAAGNPAPQETVLTTTYEYDAAGWPTAITDPLGHRTERTYDGHGLVTRVDVREQVLHGAAAAREEVFTNWYDHDALDRVTAVTDGLGNVTRFEWDSRDSLLTRVDPLGNRVRFEYDAAGRRVAEHVEITDTGLGGGHRAPDSDLTTRYEYDADGNLLCVVDPDGAATRQTFDALDRRTALSYSDGATTTYAYDGNDNVVAVHKASGFETHTTFDALDLPVRTTITDSGDGPGSPSWEAFEHDALGRLTYAANDICEHRVRIDSLGHAYEESTTVPGASVAVSLLRQQDDFGFVRRIVHPGGRAVLYEPDDLNRVVEVRNQSNGDRYPGDPGVAPDRLLAGIWYRGLRIGRREYGNGSSSTWAYDGAGRVIGLTHDGATGPLLTIEQLHDAAGNIRRRREHAAGAGAAAEVFRYDSHAQLTHVLPVEPPSAPLDLARFAPPSAPPPEGAALDGQHLIDGHLGPLAQVPGEFTFRYDRRGNRVEERRPQERPRTYVVNELDQYTGCGAVRYRYDAGGNLRELDDGHAVRRFTWNHREQLTAVDDGTERVVVRHDALGRCVSTRVGGIETYHLYDGENVVQDLRPTGRGAVEVVAEYVNDRGPDSRLHRAEGGRDRWYHTDPSGSTRLLTGSGGEQLASYRFTPFGVDTGDSPAGAEGETHLFAGRRRLDPLGLYDFRARWYDPGLGRFLERDPLDLSEGANPYLYVGNNPLTGRDPTGRQRAAGETALEETWSEGRTAFIEAGNVKGFAARAKAVAKGIGMFGLSVISTIPWAMERPAVLVADVFAGVENYFGRENVDAARVALMQSQFSAPVGGATRLAQLLARTSRFARAERIAEPLAVAAASAPSTGTLGSLSSAALRERVLLQLARTTDPRLRMLELDIRQGDFFIRRAKLAEGVVARVHPERPWIIQIDPEQLRTDLQAVQKVLHEAEHVAQLATRWDYSKWRIAMEWLAYTAEEAANPAAISGNPLMRFILRAYELRGPQKRRFRSWETYRNVVRVFED